jgi:hypothetical protein
MNGMVETEIQNANAFGDQIENLVIARGQVSSRDRNNLLLAY